MNYNNNNNNTNSNNTESAKWQNKKVYNIKTMVILRKQNLKIHIKLQFNYF